MNELTVLMTFAMGLTAALALGFLAKRLHVSPIVGYLVAGVGVGPFTQLRALARIRAAVVFPTPRGPENK